MNFNDAQCLVMQAYLSILHRIPDSHGLQIYSQTIASGEMTWHAALRQIMRSDEAKELIQRARSESDQVCLTLDHSIFGSISLEDATALVKDLHSYFSDLPPDAEELEQNASLISSGLVNPFQLFRLLSERFYALSDQKIPEEQGIDPGADGVEAKPSLTISEAGSIVADIYRYALGRQPDESGLHSFTTALVTGQSSPVDLMRELLRSEEATHYQSRFFGVVISVYRLICGRNPPENVVDRMVRRLGEDFASVVEVVQEAVNVREVHAASDAMTRRLQGRVTKWPANRPGVDDDLGLFRAPASRRDLGWVEDLSALDSVQLEHVVLAEMLHPKTNLKPTKAYYETSKGKSIEFSQTARDRRLEVSVMLGLATQNENQRAEP